MTLSNIGLRRGGASRAVFAAQGVFLLGNAFYTILYPSSVANLPDSSLRGAPNSVVRCIGYVSKLGRISILFLIVPISQSNFLCFGNILSDFGLSTK